MDRLGVWPGRIDSILVKIRIRIWIRDFFFFLSDSSPLRERTKNVVVMYSMISQKSIGPDMFSWIRHCVVAVWALPSALLVSLMFVRPQTSVYDRETTLFQLNVGILNMNRKSENELVV